MLDKYRVTFRKQTWCRRRFSPNVVCLTRAFEVHLIGFNWDWLHYGLVLNLGITHWANINSLFQSDKSFAFYSCGNADSKCRSLLLTEQFIQKSQIPNAQLRPGRKSVWDVLCQNASLCFYLFISFQLSTFWGPLGPLGRSGRAGITSIYSGRAFREACQPGRWLMSDSLGAAADNPSGEWWRAEPGRRRQAFHFLMFLMACCPWRVIPQSVLFLYMGKISSRRNYMSPFFRYR